MSLEEHLRDELFHRPNMSNKGICPSEGTVKYARRHLELQEDIEKFLIPVLAF